MTDFRARGTIMGLAGLTAVFGMGTGGTPPVSSPEFGRRGDQASPAAVVPGGWSHRLGEPAAVRWWSNRISHEDRMDRVVVDEDLETSRSIEAVAEGISAAADRGGQAVGC